MDRVSQKTVSMEDVRCPLCNRKVCEAGENTEGILRFRCPRCKERFEVDLTTHNNHSKII